MGSDRLVAASTKRVVARLLRVGGYEVHRIERTPRAQYEAQARPFVERHAAQSRSMVEALRERYREPLFGEVTVWSRVEMMSRVIDRMDVDLMNVSQEIHILLLLERMIADGVDDESLLLTAILHDLGKVLYLVGEDPANISGCNTPIGEHEPGQGLAHCTLTWNHDEFGYSRFVGRVPDHVEWLIRYHSIVPSTCLPLMDDRDRDYYDRYWVDFHRWEAESKSVHRVPSSRITDYRDLVDAAFPDPIPF